MLCAENVFARRYFFPGCHRMEPYRSTLPSAHLRLPGTERLSARVLSLPTGTAIDPETVDLICEIVRFASSRAAEITERLARTERSSTPPTLASSPEVA